MTDRGKPKEYDKACNFWKSGEIGSDGVDINAKRK
jgi:hypothetical protein